MTDTNSTIDEEAKNTVETYVLYSASTGLIPVPLADIAAFVGVQMKLVHTLSDLYGVPYDETQTKSRIYALLGAVGTGTLASSLFGSLVKTIPGIGSIIGTVTMPVAAGAVTYAIGQIFIRHFSAGGDLNDLSVEQIKPLLKTKVKEGVAVAKSLHGSEAPTAASDAAPIRIPVEPVKETPERSGKVYCILKPKLGKQGKVYLKGYFQGKRPEKYIGTLTAFQERYGVEDLNTVKDQIIEDHLAVYDAFIRERYPDTESK